MRFQTQGKMLVDVTIKWEFDGAEALPLEVLINGVSIPGQIFSTSWPELEQAAREKALEK